MKKYISSKNICDYHNEIIKLSIQIQDLKERDFEFVSDVLNHINNLASEINDLAEYALNAGQRMEDRLSFYKDTIESLGFKRIKK